MTLLVLALGCGGRGEPACADPSLAIVRVTDAERGGPVRTALLRDLTECRLDAWMAARDYAEPPADSSRLIAALEVWQLPSRSERSSSQPDPIGAERAEIAALAVAALASSQAEVRSEAAAVLASPYAPVEEHFAEFSSALSSETEVETLVVIGRVD